MIYKNYLQSLKQTTMLLLNNNGRVRRLKIVGINAAIGDRSDFYGDIRRRQTREYNKCNEF